MLIVRVCIVLLLVESLARGEPTSGLPAINPDTILVGRFNFVRPTDWIWLDTRHDLSNIVQAVTFRIDAPNSEEGAASINLFRPMNPEGTPQSVVQRWRNLFVAPPPNLAFGEPEIIGTTKVSYLEINGTMKPATRSGKIRPSHALYGAIIEEPQGNLTARWMGPIHMLPRHKVEFRKMIENAVKEQ
jgi:hypothetical protein